MPDKPPSKKSKHDPEISLQSVVDAHLQRLLTCQAGVLQCHAGLLDLGEADMDQYRAQMPPLPTAGQPMTFLQSSRQARLWLVANALRDVIMLHIVYFEQLRQFLGLARIGRSAGSDAEKQVEAKAMIEDKPADTARALERLDSMVEGGWPRKPEFRAFETLYSVFAALASGQTQNLPPAPVVVTLCLPEIKGKPGGDGNLPYEVRRVTKTYARPADAEPDRELLYEIFFTAFIICKDTAEACAKTLGAAAPPPGEKDAGAAALEA